MSFRKKGSVETGWIEKYGWCERSKKYGKRSKKFNENKKEPIYLIQGIYFDETYLKDGYDPQNSDVKTAFKTNVKLIIDSVHGNPYNYDKPDILQFYKFCYMDI